VALDTFTGLTTAVADWLNRADLTSQVPDFVRLFEAQAERNLRTREMIARATTTLDAQYTQLPVDFLALVNVQLNGTTPARPALNYAPMSEIDRIRSEAPNGGRPTDYTIVGANLEVAPVPDTSYTIEIAYYQKLTRLSVSNQTNWLLTAHPDLYLYGTLMQAAPYLKDDARVQMWAAAMTQLYEDIRIADERATKGGHPLKMRIRPYGRL
jgi:hypothetical protein